jgi:hypothetical protein
MRSRLSPTFVVAVLALVLAAGGTGYAAGKITSAQIKDNTIKSKDVKDRALTGTDLKDGGITGADLKDEGVTGADIRNGSVGRAELGHACAADEEPAFGGCVGHAAVGPSSHQAAIDDCNQRNGRLPTTAEIKWIAAHTEWFAWADGNVSNYEFTSDYTGDSPFTPLAFDRGGNPYVNASAQLFWHHCVTY